jgi:hypothetical protein
MTFSSVANPVYDDPANQSIRCTVVIAGRSGTLPYLAVNGDATSQALFDACVAGEYGAVGPYVAPAVTSAQLRAVANAKVDALFAVPRSYALSGGVSVLCDATTQTGVNLNGLMIWGQANPTATTNWVDDNGAVTTLTGAQCVALALAALAYAQSVYAVLASAMNGITAGSITTTSEINALSWPA